MEEENLIIHKTFSRVVSGCPDRIALQIKKDDSWQRFTYREVEQLSLKVAAFLIREGLKKGDFVALILENRPEWGIIYLGLMQAGLTCVPLDPALSESEIKNLISDSGAKIIFCSQKIFKEKIRSAINDSPVKAVVLDATEENPINFSRIKNISADNCAFPQVYPEDIASLIYTSGTTGRPKGVLLSHGNFCSNFNSIKKMNICFPSDNFLSLLPLYHSYAFMVTLIVPLLLSAKVTYCLSFKSDELSRIIREEGITILVGVPQLFSLLHKAVFEKLDSIPVFLRLLVMPFVRFGLRRKFSSLRLMVSGGARLEPKIGRDLSSLGLRFIEGYGLTETSPVTTINSPGKVRFGSVGKSLPDVQVKILNPDSSGNGQVLIKGPNVMRGYFKNPELTARTIRDGWLYTSDLGYIDREGYLFLAGREEEVIVLSSGKNIYPEELEDYYLQSPYIKEMCVVLKQEKSFGHLRDSLFAVIVPDLDYFMEQKEANVYEKIRWNLETLGRNILSYKHIMGFTLTREELPRTPLRKIKRFKVQKKYLEARPSEIKETKNVLSEEDREILKKDTAKKIIEYIAKQVNKPVDLNSHLEIDLGIDSLTRVEMGLGLEALLKIKIPDELLYSIATVKDVVGNIEGLMKIAPVAAGEKETVQKAWGQILRELPPEEILNKIKLDFGILEVLLTAFFRNSFLFIFKVFWSLRIEGRENIPGQGPYLICPNHASYLDVLFVFCSLPFRAAMNTYFVGYQKILEHPMLAWANKAGRFLSVDTSVHLTEAMQAVSFVLSRRKATCIFPEGMRSIDANIKEFKKGVGILIKELDIPVIPVYIKGSHFSWPRGERLPRFYPIKVIFGSPVTLKELTDRARQRGESSPDSYEAIAGQLREEVLKLS